MADEEEIFPEAPIDRTPYGACWAVGIIVVLVFILSVNILWRAGTYFKQHRDGYWKSVTDFFHRSGNNIQNGVNKSASDLQNAASNKAKEAGDNLKNQAEQKASEAGQAAASTVQNQVKQSVESALPTVPLP